MQLGQSMSMRPELRQLLTPRMIQSMEILQLPLAQLEERIEQELQSNPVLEMREGESDPDVIPDSGTEPAREERTEDERALVVRDDSNHSEDFDRLARLESLFE